MHRLRYKASVRRDLERVPDCDLEAVVRTIKALKDNPLPSGTVKVKGTENPYFRVRRGDYRIGYRIYGKERIVEIIFVRRRAESTCRAQ